MTPRTKDNVTAAHEVVERLKQRIADFRETAAGEITGRVREVGDGIAKISGLTNVGSMEMVTFEDGTSGVALNLEEDQVGAVVLGDAMNVKAGQTVKATGKVLSIPVGKAMTGRVVDRSAARLTRGERSRPMRIIRWKKSLRE